MKKILAIGLFATGITFSLFAFMAFLVANDKMSPVMTDPGIVIDIVTTPPETEMVKIIRFKNIPPPTPAQPPRIETEVEPSLVDNALGYAPPQMISSELTTSFDHAPGVRDADARPIVRVNPKYPVDAARNGLEGWVKLAFNINALGEVVDIKVLGSQPKRVFDKAAKQALKKWKYQAKKQDGVVIVQQGLTVQLDFKIDQTPS